MRAGGRAGGRASERAGGGRAGVRAGSRAVWLGAHMLWRGSTSVRRRSSRSRRGNLRTGVGVITAGAGSQAGGLADVRARVYLPASSGARPCANGRLPRERCEREAAARARALQRGTCAGVLTARTGGARAESAGPALPGGPAGGGSTGAVVSVSPRAACTSRWST